MLKRLIIVQIILLGFQSALYFGCEKFQKRLHDVKKPLDDYIPFLPKTVILYCLWFPLIFFFPIYLYYQSPICYQKYMIIMILEVLVSVFCYLIYPTTFERPVPPDDFWGKFMKFIYKGSYRGLNCAPSLHCSSSFLIMYMALFCDGIFSVRLISFAASVLVVISTLTTKQHVVVDVLSAVFLFLLCMRISHLIPISCFNPVLEFIVN